MGDDAGRFPSHLIDPFHRQWHKSFIEIDENRFTIGDGLTWRELAIANQVIIEDRRFLPSFNSF